MALSFFITQTHSCLPMRYTVTTTETFKPIIDTLQVNKYIVKEMKWHKPSIKMIIYYIIHSYKIRLNFFCSQQTEKSKWHKTLENIHNRIHWRCSEISSKVCGSVIIKITFPDRLANQVVQYMYPLIDRVLWKCT